MRECNLDELIKYLYKMLKCIEADKTIICFLRQKIEIGSLSIRRQRVYLGWRPIETPKKKFRTTIINFKGVE